METQKLKSHATLKLEIFISHTAEHNTFVAWKFSCLIFCFKHN